MAAVSLSPEVVRVAQWLGYLRPEEGRTAPEIRAFFDSGSSTHYQQSYQFRNGAAAICRQEADWLSLRLYSPGRGFRLSVMEASSLPQADFLLGLRRPQPGSPHVIVEKATRDAVLWQQVSSGAPFPDEIRFAGLGEQVPGWPATDGRRSFYFYNPPLEPPFLSTGIGEFWQYVRREKLKMPTRSRRAYTLYHGGGGEAGKAIQVEQVPHTARLRMLVKPTDRSFFSACVRPFEVHFAGDIGPAAMWGLSPAEGVSVPALLLHPGEERTVISLLNLGDQLQVREPVGKTTSGRLHWRVEKTFSVKAIAALAVLALASSAWLTFFRIGDPSRA